MKATVNISENNYIQEENNEKSIINCSVPDYGKEVFAAGTSFTPYQTDGKSYVDLKTKDGRIVRLEIDISKWPRTVNEIPEDECFENLMYAG